MKIKVMEGQAVEQAMIQAERLMEDGRWSEAEAVLRECCTHPSDLVLRLTQLQMRKQCACYAHVMLTHSTSMEQALSLLEDKFEYYSAQWVLTTYKNRSWERE